VLEGLRHENRVLDERLSAAAQFIDEKQTQLALLNTRLHECGTTNFTVREAEEKLTAAADTISRCAQQVAALEGRLLGERRDRRRLEAEIERLKEQLSRQNRAADGMRTDIAVLERQNAAFRDAQKDINHIKRKYAAKKKQLMERIVGLENEKRKWEVIGKFAISGGTAMVGSTQ
jgi:chromosome segregation ATPase